MCVVLPPIPNSFLRVGCLGIGRMYALACFEPLIPKRFSYCMCYVFFSLSTSEKFRITETGFHGILEFYRNLLVYFDSR